MKLYIDISQIMNFINKIKEQRSGLLVCSCIEKGNIFEFSFKENGKEGLITFYFNKDGYTTCRASNKNKKAEGEILDLLAKDKSTYAKFEDLKPYSKNIKAVIGMGECRERVRNFGESINVPTYIYDYIDKATEKAYEISSPGDVILLSPGSASWDQFKQCEDRGALFKKIVKSFENK